MAKPRKIEANLDAKVITNIAWKQYKTIRIQILKKQFFSKLLD